MATPFGRRVIGAVLGVLLLALGLSACGTSNSVVATVGDSTITVTEFDKTLEKAYADPVVGEAVEEQGDAFRQNYLTLLVQNEIIEQIAAEQGIEITDADIQQVADDQFQGETIDTVQSSYAAQGQYYTKDQIWMLLKQIYVQSEVGVKVSGMTLDELTAQTKTQLEQQAAQSPGLYDSWDLDFVSVDDPTQGQAWVDALNSGETTIDQVGAEAGALPDGTPQPSTTSLTGEDAQSSGFLEQMAPLETGDAGLLSLADQSTGTMTYVLVQVVSRTAGDLDTQAQQQAQSSFTDQGGTAIADAAKSIDIEINPRYGTLERPEQGLPSVGTGDPGTFTTPTSAASTDSAVSGVTG